MKLSLLLVFLFASLAHAKHRRHYATVTAQMFQWTWDSVAAECANFLGPAGYEFVQGEHHSNLIHMLTRRVPVLTALQ